MNRLAALALLACAALLAACAQPPRPTPTPEDTLRIVTLNIYHDRAEWARREPLVVAGLRQLQPDVITLQEVLQHEQLPNQAQTIADALGYRVHFVSIDPESAARRYGNAILTRHHLLHAGAQRLQPLEDSRTVAHARIDTGSATVDVYATHLHWTHAGGSIRERQVRDLVEYIAATRGDAPVIVAGDFNAPADAPEFALLREGFVDAYGAAHPSAGDGTGEAYTTLNPAFFERRSRIDHVFVERGRVDVVDAARILDAAGADGTWPSDHFGISATLRLRR